MSDLDGYSQGILLAGALGNLALAGYVLSRARGSLSALWQLCRLPTTPIDRLGVGEVEVAGALTSIGPPVRAFDGRPCVVVHTEIICRCKDSQDDQQERTHTGQQALLRDGTGACLVSLDDAIVVSLRRTDRGDPERMKKKYPHLLAHTPAGARSVEIIEHSIEEGAEVLVSATAIEPAGPAEVPESFRDNAQRLLLLRGDGQRKILVARGAQWRVLLQIGQPLLSLLLLALVYGFQAAVMLWRL